MNKWMLKCCWEESLIWKMLLSCWFHKRRRKLSTWSIRILLKRIVKIVNISNTTIKYLKMIHPTPSKITQNKGEKVLNLLIWKKMKNLGLTQFHLPNTSTVSRSSSKHWKCRKIWSQKKTRKIYKDNRKILRRSWPQLIFL